MEPLVARSGKAELREEKVYTGEAGDGDGASELSSEEVKK
jgi:hypothetical protein